jgi:hypothetical protein|tara:strand:+ start:6518 stop:7162 length:645 start_codon:yes stop_codon:yes gene_type:complete
MWGYVKDNKVIEIIRFPRTFIDTENNIKHPRAIFNTWTWEQLNAIGLYQVVDSGTKGDDKFEYTSQATYTFSSKNKNITTSYTIHEKDIEDSEAKDDDGKNILDEDGNKVMNYGLKTQAIEQTKITANSLISRFSWLVERSIYDSSKTIPDAVKTYVASIRTDCEEIETAVTNCKTLDDFKALYDNELNKDGTIKTQNRMGRWTDDKTVKEYLR